MPSLSRGHRRLGGLTNFDDSDWGIAMGSEAIAETGKRIVLTSPFLTIGKLRGMLGSRLRERSQAETVSRKGVMR
jgi:hypothetical protein